MVDVLVAGAGPAGWSLASACARLGLSVLVVAPRPLDAWRATYGLWLDEVVVLPPGSRYVTARPRGLSRWYAVLDNASVQASLRDSAIRTRVGLVRGLVPGGVRLADGEVLAARVVVDATGVAARGRVQQTAFGVVVPAAVAAPVVGPGEAVFMDWRGDGSTFLYAVPVADGRVLLEETSLARRPGMGMRELRERLCARLAGHGIVLGADPPDAVALADAPSGTDSTNAPAGPTHGAPPDTKHDSAPSNRSPDASAWPMGGVPSGFGDRESRCGLDRRAAGSDDRDSARTSKAWPPAPGINSTGEGRQFLSGWAMERVRFAVDVPAPSSVGRGAIPFGAAAGFVHPATGFSVADTLRLAPVVAAAIARTIGLGPIAVNLAARHAMWSPAARVVHRLRQRGLATLLALPPESVPGFFELFFALPAQRQIAYLCGRDDVVGTAAAMAALYRSAPGSLRRVMAGLRQTGESELGFMNSG